MNLLRSPKNKVVIVTLLLVGLGLARLSGRLDLVTVSRWTLGLACVAGLVFWWWRARASEPRFHAPERLRVISRTGLSQRCSLALVELDGETLLVAFGDGFAQMKTVRARGPATLVGGEP